MRYYQMVCRYSECLLDAYASPLSVMSATVACDSRNSCLAYISFPWNYNKYTMFNTIY